jgi:peptidoglycan/xylan/chitin deacetylase (PgdA/CDA1 family)
MRPTSSRTAGRGRCLGPACLLLPALILIGCAGTGGRGGPGRAELRNPPPAAPQLRVGDWSYRLATWPRFQQAACSLTFDDGTLDQYLLAFPELEKRGIKGTFFLISGLREQGVWMDSGTSRLLFSWDQARQLAAAGHEIGSHGHKHADLTATGAAVERELAASLQVLSAEIPSLSVPGGVSLSWSYWRHDKRSRRLARAYYLAARGGGGITAHQLNGSTPLDFYGVGALGLRPGDETEIWRQRAEQALTEGGWLVATFHGLDDGRIPPEARGWEPLPLGRFLAVLDYLQDRDYWLASFGDVVRYIQQRQRAELRLKQRCAGGVLLVLEDFLDERIYDRSLTVSLSLPSGWDQAAVYQHGRQLESWRDGAGRLCFEAMPDGSLILVQERNPLRSGRSVH